MNKRTLLVCLVIILAIFPSLEGIDQRMGLMGILLYGLGVLATLILAGRLLWEVWQRA